MLFSSGVIQSDGSTSGSRYPTTRCTEAFELSPARGADEGADIILPVAGPVGLGSAAFAQELGTIRIIGVDADWTQTAPEYDDIILTSVLKKVDVAVNDAARNVANGTTTPFLVSTLESGGVDIAPLTNALKDNPDLAAELEAIKALIISGEIDTNSAD